MPSALRRFLRRLESALRPAAAEADLAREIASHLALLEDELQRRGMTPEAARSAARKALGGVDQAKELHRDARSFVWLDDVRRDLRHAGRLLRRSPLFALTAALSLAVGIGANTAIFTVVNALLLRPLSGVVEPARLVDIGRSQRGESFDNNSYPNFLDVQRRATTLSAVYAFTFDARPMSLGAETGAERVYGGLVSANYFEALGTRPQAGRMFQDEDDRAHGGAGSVAVISHRLWVRRFAADRGIVSRSIVLNGHPFTVVGVAPEGFHGTTLVAPDLWVPLGTVAEVLPRAGNSLLERRASSWLIFGGRLAPGVSVAQCRAELFGIGRALAQEFPADNEGRGLVVEPSALVPGHIEPVKGFLGLLMAVVGLVLAIACVNLTGVLLARGAARRREIAVRLAIGAGRRHLVRLLLAESLVLFGIGAAAGVFLARGMTTLLVSLLPSLPVPVDVGLPLDGRVLAFTLG
ncbi:MAG: ABC transporter permease, partial [bacterium]